MVRGRRVAVGLTPLDPALTVVKCSQLKKEIQQITAEVLMRQAAMAGTEVNRNREFMTMAPQTTASTFDLKNSRSAERLSTASLLEGSLRSRSPGGQWTLC